MSLRNREEAELILRMEENLTHQLKGIEDRMGGLSKAGSNAAEGLNKGWGSVGRTLASVTGISFGAAGAIMAIQKAWTFAMAGLDDQRINARFTAMAGGAQQAASNMRALRAAAEDSIEDTELQRTAVTLGRIGVRAAEAQAAVVGFARAWGKENNLRQDEAMKRVTDALKTGSSRGLAQFGIRVDEAAVLREAAAAQGILVAQLSRGERIAALQAAAIESMRNELAFVVDESSAFERISTKIANRLSEAASHFAYMMDPNSEALDRGRKEGLKVDLDQAAGNQGSFEAEVAKVKAAQAKLAELKAELAQVPQRSYYGAGPEANEAVSQLLEREIAFTKGQLDALIKGLEGKKNDLATVVTDTVGALSAWKTSGVALGQDFLRNAAEMGRAGNSLLAFAKLALTIDTEAGSRISRVFSGLANQAFEAQRALAELQGTQRQVAQADLGDLRSWTQELARLNSLGLAATDADKERIAQLKSMVDYFGSLHREALGVAKAMDTWVTSERGVLSLDRSAAQLEASFKRASEEVIKGGDGQAVAIMAAQRALEAHIANLRSAGVPQSELNLLWEAGNTKLAYFRQGLKDFNREVLAFLGQKLTLPPWLGAIGANLGKTIQETYAQGVKDFKPPKAPRSGSGTKTRLDDVSAMDEFEVARLQGKYSDAIESIQAKVEAQIADLDKGKMTAEKYKNSVLRLRLEATAEIAKVESERVAASARASAAAREASITNGQLWADQATAELRAFEDAQFARLGVFGIETEQMIAKANIFRALEDKTISEVVAREQLATLELQAEYNKRQAGIAGWAAAYQNAVSQMSGAVNALVSVAGSRAVDREFSERVGAIENYLSKLGAAQFELAAADQKVIDRQKELDKATKGSDTYNALQADISAANKSLVAGKAATISAIGGLAATFIGMDQGAKAAAATMAAFALASAVFAGVSGDPQQAAGYAVSAGMFAALAARAPDNKKPKAKPEIVSQGLSAPVASNGSLNVTINLSEGVIYGTPEELADRLIRVIGAGKWGNASIPKQLVR